MLKIGDVVQWPEVIEKMQYFFTDEMYAMASDGEIAILFFIKGKNPVTLEVVKRFKKESQERE